VIPIAVLTAPIPSGKPIHTSKLRARGSVIPIAASVISIPSHLSIHGANILAGGGVVATAALTAYAFEPLRLQQCDPTTRHTGTAALVVHPAISTSFIIFHFREIVSAVYPKLWVDSEASC